MTIKTEETNRLHVLENLLAEARAEADELRGTLERYRQIIDSTRLIMGHELKKPTTAISGYLDLACEDLENASELGTLSLVEKARAECSLLNELNEFYLDLLRVDADEQLVGQELVDVASTVQEAIAELPGKHRAKERVVVDVRGTIPPVRFNRNALKLIVTNLVENALLYGQVDKPVRVEVERARDKRGMPGGYLLKIRVIDKGIGIPRSYINRIFTPFVRLREDIAEGSGLGLTLVRSLVDLNGGDVFIRSEKGQGTEVHVTLPADETEKDQPVILL